jgi:hypothetical protein
LDPTRTDFSSRIASTARPPAFATSPFTGFWQSAIGVSPVLFQVNLPVVSEVQGIDMLFNNPIVSGSLPLAIGVETSDDDVTYAERQYFAQNCVTFISRPMGVPCETTGSSRSISLPLSLTAKFIRLRLFASSPSRPIEVCRLDFDRVFQSFLLPLSIFAGFELFFSFRRLHFLIRPLTSLSVPLCSFW